jgi:hypothetical protein
VSFFHFHVGFFGCLPPGNGLVHSLRFPDDLRRSDNNRQPVDFLKKIDTSHPELYLEQNSEVKKSRERIHAFGNEDDENEAQ